jgi:hypothetical protein
VFDITDSIDEDETVETITEHIMQMNPAARKDKFERFILE